MFRILYNPHSLLTNDPRGATVTAMSTTTCAVISKADFNTWLNAHPGVEINLLNVLAEKLEYMTEKTHQMELSIIYEKTVKILNGLAKQKGNQLVIEKQPSAQELAVLIGTSKRLVSTVLKELSKNKHIVTKGQALHISSLLPESW